MDFIQQWAPRCELPVTQLLAWLGLGRSKWASWKARYGRVNEHNAWIPRDFRLQGTGKRPRSLLSTKITPWKAIGV